MRKQHVNWVVGAAALIGTMAWAGHKSYDPVNITSSGAGGSFGSARNSPDGAQYIACTINATSGSSPYVYCFASDTIGGYASCYSYDANLVATVRAINGDSYLQFTFNTSGICTNLYVMNGSHPEPKKP